MCEPPLASGPTVICKPTAHVQGDERWPPRSSGRGVGPQGWRFPGRCATGTSLVRGPARSATIRTSKRTTTSATSPDTGSMCSGSVAVTTGRRMEDGLTQTRI